MSDLESIVRPSVALDYAPAKRYFQPGQIGTPNTHLRIGRSGSGKALSGSDSANASYYMTAYHNEAKQADFGTAF